MPGSRDGGGVAADPGRYLLRVHDLDGRPRGLGFVTDLRGTVLTAHQTVAGLDRLVLHTPGGQTRVLGPDRVDPLPELGLALLHTEALGGLPVPPLPLAATPAGLAEWPAAGPAEVLVAGVPGEDGRAAVRTGGVLGGTTGGYAWAERFHLVDGVLLVDLEPAAGLPGVPPGAPVLDARSGAVVALAAPAVRSPREGGTFPAVPVGGRSRPGAAAPAGAFAAALARNAAAVPAYGPALNLAGVLRLAAAQTAAAGAGPGRIAGLAADRVDRPDGLTGDEPGAVLSVLLGAPGSGRSTELAALAVRRGGGERPLPTLWLRGADLGAPGRDPSPARAVGRALAAAADALGVGPAPEPEEAARLCAAAGRPLLVILDGPEEAAAPLDGAWLRATGRWLASCGARLLTACGEEAWERLTEGPADTVPPAAVHLLGPLPAEAADRVRRRYGVPPGRPAAGDARHPLALRLAGELRAAGLHGEPAHRGELFSAHLDLRCLRVAERIVTGEQPRRPGAHRRGAAPRPGPAPGRVRRLAAAVAGRVHEAARRMLGDGSGGLSRAGFEELFPPVGGWAAAVLAEGLFVPAGTGYRPAHGEFADWLLGLHLDLDEALRLLLGETADTPPPELARGVPRHRIGPVAAALHRLADTGGAPALDPWLHRLHRALELRPPGSEPGWWAARLLAGALAASPDPAQHSALLDELAERTVERAAAAGGFEGLPAAGLGRFGPAFWTGLRLAPGHRFRLLRRLVRADGPGQPFLTATAELLRADPAGVIPPLCDWLGDTRHLPARPDTTVADLAHHLLHTHRRLALDDLTEALAGVARPRADDLLAALAAEEPSALCRAVDRWSHDPRPERHVAAAVHALRTAPYAHGPGLDLLRFAALTLLAREDEPALHGAALALLVRDGRSRAAHLPAALALYRRGSDAFLTARALAPALESDPEAVLAAFAARLAEAGAEAGSEPGSEAGSEADETLRVLAEVRSPSAARHCAELAGRLRRERREPEPDGGGVPVLRPTHLPVPKQRRAHGTL